jgi:2-polyprenyl-3-methyl-5-hydroxy-6-metoxy-1,4-benzoquinol methylase
VSHDDREPEPPNVGELIARLNTGWRIAGPETGASLKQRVIMPLRSAIARLFRTQETFNSLVVQYVNHQHHTISEEHAAMMEELQRYRESLMARERRMESAMTALLTENAEMQTTLGVLQQQVRSGRSDRSGGSERSDRSLSDRSNEPATNAPNGPIANVPNVPNDPNAPNDSVATHALSAAYVGFEDQFRGSPEAIRARLLEYLPIFSGATDVLDVGCGRGEFLRLLAEHGVSARGIDLNESMVDVCRQQGLEASAADALSYLRAQPDGSLGGLFAAQVVEHLEPGYLTQFLDAAFDKLRPGAPIVLETINPACWFAFFESYVRDITHVRPLHPDTLKFLLVATGFQQLAIQYRAPYPEHEKLQHVAAPALGDSAETLNANVDKLNSLLFTYLDYAAVGHKPGIRTQEAGSSRTQP